MAEVQQELQDIDMERMDRKFFDVGMKADQVLAHHQKKSAMISAKYLAGQEEGRDVDDELRDRSGYWEGVAIGTITGFTREYNKDCSRALIAAIASGFDTAENMRFWEPSKFAKFNIAQTKFMEDTNQVYARCHFSDYTREISEIFNVSDPYELIPKGSRAAATMGTTGTGLLAAASEGKATNNGFLVGKSYAELISQILNASL